MRATSCVSARPQQGLCPHLSWTTDDFPWLRAEYEGQGIFCRVNPSFPDDPLHSLLIDNDRTVKFDDFPTVWERGPLDWPQAEQ